MYYLRVSEIGSLPHAGGDYDDLEAALKAANDMVDDGFVYLKSPLSSILFMGYWPKTRETLVLYKF